MSPIDKKLIKLVWNNEFMLEYLPFYSEEQKLKHIKIIRWKLREIERRENRVIKVINSVSVN